MTTLRITTIGLLLIILPATLAQTPANPAPDKPTFTATLHPAQTNLNPGGQTDLAITVTVQEDYHVYHPILTGPGVPTTVSFDLPPGLTVSELRFPIPYEGQDGEQTYLGLDTEFTILTTLHAAADIDPGPATIYVRVDGLACKELCIPVSATADLTLPINDAPPQPANAELFEDARLGVPAAPADANYLKDARLRINKDQLGVNQDAELVFTATVEDELHIQDRDPGNENLIPSRLYLEPVPGMRFGDQQWPDPKVKKMPFFGTVREQAGKVEIRVPVTIIDTKFPAGPVTVRALFTYQACNDAGSCFPPEATLVRTQFVADTPNTESALPLSAFLPGEFEAEKPPAASGGGSLWLQMLFGFLGGLILNIMPCVFPVISIKIISFVKQAGEVRKRVLGLGLAFCAGIMVWFWVFAVLTGLGEIPWQYPSVIIGLSALLFVFALNLFGVFEIVLPGAAATSLDQAAAREGYLGAFMKGLLATLLGTACTAPFFAGAAAYAATQPAYISFLVFTAAGLGMSSPYLLLSAFPGWLRWLPKPGAWMVVFKQAMGFVLVGTVVWLLYILAHQVGGEGVVWTVALLGFLGVSAWLIGKIQFTWSDGARVVTWAAALVIGGVGWWFCFAYMYDLSAPQDAGGVKALPDVSPVELADTIERNLVAAEWGDGIPWQPYVPGVAAELSERGYTVYVDYTATWCVTCQTNKASSLEIGSTRELMQEMGVVPIKADWTNRNPRIREELLRWRRNSVPLNLIYPADQPESAGDLPAVLTPGIVQSALRSAGPSRARFALGVEESAAVSRLEVEAGEGE